MVVKALLPNVSAVDAATVDVQLSLKQLFAQGSSNGHFPYVLCAMLILGPLVLLLAWDELSGPKYAWVQPLFAYCPRWASGIVWAFGSLGIMRKAYDKFNQTAYRVVRPDTDLIVLPSDCVQELSILKDDTASTVNALDQDLNARFTGMGGFRDLHLHHLYVQKKINPNLHRLVPGMDKEILQALAEELALAETDWQEVTVHQLLITLAVRVSARLMLGEDFSASKEWRETSKGFLQKLLETVTVFRFFPAWLHPVLYYIVPSRYAVTKLKKRAGEMLRPVFTETLRAQATGHWKPSEVEDGATWGIDHMTDLASEAQRTPDALVHCEVFLIAASIPAMVATETNALFDLVGRSDCLKFVRDEVHELAKSQDPFTPTGLKSMHKLDSFLRESQRVNPAATIGMRRIMKKDYVLKNGILLPKGSYVCCPVYVIQEKNTENPEVFDGLRSYRKRLNEQGIVDSQRHTFVSTEPTVLAFGLGRSACPGRFLADAVIKLTIAKLATDYEIKFARGQVKRPENFKFHEFNLPSPFSTLMMRKRR